MSGDPRDPRDAHEDVPSAAPVPRPADSPARSEDSGAALLTAYVDGVAELAPGERHGIEALLASDPRARDDAAAVKAMLDQLRTLPPSYDRDEPDWVALERSIHDAVSTEAPRRWWRTWRWLVPAMTCATAAAILLALWPRSGSHAPADRAALERPTRTTDDNPGREAPASDGVVALWLDGDELDIDLSASDVPSDVLAGALPRTSEAGDGDEVALLPATDLGWVDNLDGDALDRAERWLAGNNAEKTVGKKG
jgi:hypothetical protein